MEITPHSAAGSANLSGPIPPSSGKIEPWQKLELTNAARLRPAKNLLSEGYRLLDWSEIKLAALAPKEQPAT